MTKAKPSQNDEAAAARKTVCHYAADAPEAIELMMMLGIYPGQEDDGDARLFSDLHSAETRRPRTALVHRVGAQLRNR